MTPNTETSSAEREFTFEDARNLVNRGQYTIADLELEFIRSRNIITKIVIADLSYQDLEHAIERIYKDTLQELLSFFSTELVAKDTGDSIDATTIINFHQAIQYTKVQLINRLKKRKYSHQAMIDLIRIIKSETL
jgi:hypothetical protein